MKPSLGKKSRNNLANLAESKTMPIPIPNPNHKYSKATNKKIKSKKQGRRYENCKHSIKFDDRLSNFNKKLYKSKNFLNFLLN